MRILGMVIFAVASSALLSSCLKDELPVIPVERGDVVEVQFTMGNGYNEQLWFDLGTNSVVAQNSKTAWDLAFECGAAGWQVRVNPARFMRANRTSTTDITLATDTNGFGVQWEYDHSEGMVDSLAFGDWRMNDEVYVLDLGLDAEGTLLGIRRVRVLESTTTQYTFEVAAMNGSNVQQFTVQKDPSRTYVHFSILNGQQVLIAPPHGAYDLVFSQYTYQFYDPYLAYLVTGAVSGFSGCRVSEFFTNDFASVSLADTMANPFNTNEDVIGYDWKEYDFDTGIYAIFPDHVFIVQDVEGYFYKLHFTDWYNAAGQRGNPRFEVVGL